MKKGIISHLTSRECGLDNVRSLRALHSNVHQRYAKCVAEDKAAVASKNKPCCQPASSKATFLIVFNKDGKKMASLHGDHTVKVTDVATGHQLQSLRGHARTPWAAAFHPASADILATGCLAGEVRIWDLRSGTCDLWRAQAGCEIASLTFHPSEKILVIATGHNLYCWNWAISAVPVVLAHTLRNLEKIRWVKFDPSGENIFTGITNSSLLEFRPPETHRLSESWSALREPPVRNELLEQQQRGEQGRSLLTRRHGVPASRHLLLVAPRSSHTIDEGNATASAAEGQNAPRLSLYARRLSFDDDDGHDSTPGRAGRTGQPYLTLSNGRAAAGSPSELRSSGAAVYEGMPRSSLLPARDVYDQASEMARLAQLHNRRAAASAAVGSADASGSRLSGVTTGSGLRMLRSQILAASAVATFASTPPGRCCASCLRSLARQGGRTEDGSSSRTAARQTSIEHAEPTSSQDSATLCRFCFAQLPSSQPIVQAPRRAVPFDGGASRASRAPASPPPWSVEGGATGMHLADLRSRSHIQSRAASSSAAANADPAVHRLPLPESSADAGPSSSRNLNERLPRLPVFGAVASGGHLLSTLSQQRSDITEHLRELNNDLSVHQQTLQYHQERLNQIRERQQVLLENLNRLQLMHEPEHGTGVRDRIHAARPELALLQQRADELRQFLHNRRLVDPHPEVEEFVPSSLHPPAPGIAVAPPFLPEDVAAAAMFSRTDYDVVQAAINRVLADAYRGRGEAAMASNIMNMSQRIQRWSFPYGVPAVLDETSNVVIRNSKIHNDISVDISQDGSLLAAFVPSMQNSHRGFPEDMMLGVFSLQRDSWCQCLYMKRFGPNAISVSLSPGNQYVLVGLAAKRLVPSFSPWQMVAQAFKLCKEQAGEESMRHVHDVMHPCSQEATRGYVSVNCALWLPRSGQGLAYGTNHGDLHVCLPGFSESSADDEIDGWENLERLSRQRQRAQGAAANITATPASSAGQSRRYEAQASRQPSTSRPAQRQSTGTQTVERSLL